mgnify:CR=1 FL=1|tara:strand:- start:6635 stop:6931 length:297 start_codon:yes stop_codon:yes gene_type:complete
MTSSVRAKMAQVNKEKKRAIREREEQESNKQQHQKANVGGVSAKASGGDSNVASEKEKVRARDDKGHFVKDDPNTPENEAWVEKPVAKKKKTSSKKKK